MTEPEGAPRRRWPRALLALSIGLVLCELGLRWVLFGGHGTGFGLRNPSFYADRWDEDLYWRLMQRFRGDPGPMADDLYHPELGWRTRWFDPVTYEHKDTVRLAGRRPVLLFGDSFARCTVPQADCFEGLLDRSPLHDTHMLLNYGAHAYGIDQSLLLLQRTLPRWLPLGPIVVFGVFVDDDLDRAYLGYRGWPKPRLVHGANGLELESVPVPTAAEYERQHPDRTPSYLWRWLLHGGFLPDGVRDVLTGARARRLAKERLTRDVLRALESEMERHGLQYFVVLFHGLPYLGEVGPHDWREELLLRVLREEQIPFVSSKAALQKHALASGRPLSGYFEVAEGDARDHYLPLGNAVVFQAIRGGLIGQYETRTDIEPIRVDSMQLRDVVEPPLVRHLRGYSKNLPEAVDAETLLVRVQPQEATTFSWTLFESCTRFSALAKLAPAARAPGCGRMGISIHVDGQAVFGANLSPEEPEFSIDIDLRGAQRMVVNVDDGGDGVTCDLLLLSSPLFR